MRTSSHFYWCCFGGTQ